MKKVCFCPLISGLLILLFAYALLSKATDYTMFKAQLTRLPFAGRFAPVLVWSLPAAEIVTVVLLFIPVTRMAGLLLSATLLFVFTLFLTIMVEFATNLPCSCGGIIARLSWTQHIFFNLFFLAAALAGIYLEKHKKIKGYTNMP